MMRFHFKPFSDLRSAFTLMEVNLAIFIMAVGVLAMVSLYPLGYRENQQSRDDVRAAAMADLVLGQITAALSSRNIKWQDWRDKIQDAVDATDKGWRSYMESRGGGLVPVRDPSGTAVQVWRKLMSVNPNHNTPEHVPGSGDDDLKYAIVARWGQMTMAKSGGGSHTVNDYSRVSVSFRATRRSGALFAQPLYYTEIHFQGDQEELGQ